KNPDEPCVYKRIIGSIISFLILYVDDILLIGNDIPSLQAVKIWLSKRFSMKDLGEASCILGIQIYRDRSKRMLGLSQSRYIGKVLKRFSMENSKKGFVPASPGISLSKKMSPRTDEERKRMSLIPYASAVGSIMYAMLCTRPDIAYSLSLLFLIYGKSDLRMEAFSDSSFQSDIDDSKSVSGYVFTLNRGAVSWKSSKQDTVADSTMEAEYIAANDAAKEAVWMRKFLLRACRNPKDPASDVELMSIDHTDPDMNALLFKPGCTYPMNNNLLNFTSKIIARIVAHNLIPKTGSFDYFAADKVNAVYAIFAKIRVNWANVFLKNMAYKHSKFLPFGSFITLILKHFGVDLSGEPKVDPNKKYFDRVALSRMQLSDSLSSAPGEPSSSRPRSRPTTISASEVFDRLDHLETQVSSIQKDVRTFLSLQRQSLWIQDPTPDYGTGSEEGSEEESSSGSESDNDGGD
ncbi:uncharacterized protein LOC109821162, partial [Asparagus officinalis]|uniref:uncharacterized protein LOC109821162 n=1 Tax=Asparagus officinalis TaxID=4686 RepID=UPI00098E4D52